MINKLENTIFLKATYKDVTLTGMIIFHNNDNIEIFYFNSLTGQLNNDIDLIFNNWSEMNDELNKQWYILKEKLKNDIYFYDYLEIIDIKKDNKKILEIIYNDEKEKTHYQLK